MDYEVTGVEKVDGFVINRNDEEYQRFMRERQQLLEKRDLNKRLDKIEKDIQAIQRILTQSRTG
jgi:hypothetical protein